MTTSTELPTKESLAPAGSETLKEENIERKKFEDLLTNPLLLENLTVKMGFDTSTAIQAAVMPSILEGRDVYAGAKTGSGKTVAFLAPIVQGMLDGKVRKALVLSPTRELALQIDDEAMRLFDGQKNHVSIPLYGGVPLEQQLRAMNAHKPTLYIATPGRMIDFIGEGCIALADIDICVLDEADRMCDMGFEPQVNEILSSLPNRKQTLMFSATLPKEVNNIMSKFLDNPVSIQIDSPQTSSSTIIHRAIFVDRRRKLPVLKDLLRSSTGASVVFTRTRKGADNLFEKLGGNGNARASIGILHAGYSMGERERTIRQFKEGRIQHLIATDVASRGLDVDHISQVVHFELPETLDDYIHRSGRSGRAGRAGMSISFIDPENSMQRKQIEGFAEKIKIEFEDAPQGQRRDHGDSSSSEDNHQDEGNRDRRPRRQSASERTGNAERSSTGDRSASGDASSTGERSSTGGRNNRNRNRSRNRNRNRPREDGVQANNAGSDRQTEGNSPWRKTPHSQDAKGRSRSRSSGGNRSQRGPRAAEAKVSPAGGILKAASKILGGLFRKK
jgi:superfamily II DNA/RNA helicase